MIVPVLHLIKKRISYQFLDRDNFEGNIDFLEVVSARILLAKIEILLNFKIST